MKKGSALLLGTLSLSALSLFRVGSETELHGAARYAGGAPPGFTGGFDEMACDACHFDHLLNPPGGSLTIGGLPENFAPRASYPITVTLVRPGMKAGGFQLAARFVEGGGQAGEFDSPEGEGERLALVSKGGVQYLHQTDPGSRSPLPDTVRWSFVWTAPSEGGAVIFHAAGNAADGDGSTSGDFVHTTFAESVGSQP